MTKGIALGNHATIQDTKERINNQKKRLREIIRKNKLNINPSQFKFYYEKSTQDSNYPYFSYVNTPEEKYNWIFIT